MSKGGQGTSSQTADFGIIAHHSSSLEQNAGDVDDYVIDRFTLEVPQNRLINKAKVISISNSYL
jgi:hypothetical protein